MYFLDGNKKKYIYIRMYYYYYTLYKLNYFLLTNVLWIKASAKCPKCKWKKISLQ